MDLDCRQSHSGNMYCTVQTVNCYDSGSRLQKSSFVQKIKNAMLSCPSAYQEQEDRGSKAPQEVSISYSADIWAFGCCFYSILSGCSHLVKDVEAYQQTCTSSFPELLAEIVEKFVEKRLKHLKGSEVHLKSLKPILASCLKGSPRARASAGQLRAALMKELK